MIFLYAVLAILHLLPNIHAVEITDCAPPDAVGKLIKAEVGDCGPQDSVCNIKINTNVKLTINFKALKGSPTVTQKGYLTRGGLNFELPPEFNDACKNTSLVCPLKPGPTLYAYELFINPALPRSSYTTRWLLLDSSGNTFVCIELPIKVSS